MSGSHNRDQLKTKVYNPTIYYVWYKLITINLSTHSVVTFVAVFRANSGVILPRISPFKVGVARQSDRGSTTSKDRPEPDQSQGTTVIAGDHTFWISHWIGLTTPPDLPQTSPPPVTSNPAAVLLGLTTPLILTIITVL